MKLAHTLWVICSLLFVALDAEADSVHLAPTRDAGIYNDALARERPDTPPAAGVTGLTVPHHLVAADLMARGFFAASGGSYDRVILISPDHFRAVGGAFATAATTLNTPFGPLSADERAVETLLADKTLFEQLDEHELEADHGLQAPAPFIRKLWPNAQIVPVLASISTTKEDWLAAAALLAPLVTHRTLVVQSTDFSHYLSRAEAVLRDQESLGVIASGDVDLIARLDQPRHLDSKAAMAIQSILQSGLGAKPTVIGNRNQAEYGGDPENGTSYVTAVWTKDALLTAALDFQDQEVVYFAGDTFPGRYLVPHLRVPGAADRIIESAQSITRNRPLVVNLEGVLLEERPVGAPPRAHIMNSREALPLLSGLGVIAAGLANNHARDLGQFGEEETGRLLRAAGIKALTYGEVVDLGPVRVMPLTMFRNGQHPISEEDAKRIVCAAEARPPLVVFIHWGEEWKTEPGPAELDLGAHFGDCGATLVIGHHSHVASRSVIAQKGGAAQMVYSLGNFLFDQSGPRAGGAILEARFFSQRTVAVRIIPLPNYFDLVRGKRVE